ncbi:hypothetical protein PGT21_000916 [Puccinia graminis f. sp. tritici]|uniref:Uncharacterized protein n=1 Tax=Puccinia graminis f. sp. tritici TaxID=56615 RepID=A0A5B0PCU4_PUCGR|nr:hypothetical protein PGT21_034094 [Puccinia graminis f. sp. tritici]KAA1098903.1 hypothetical protein PGT21_000171 [Puccinia graminis f. sp. tritici]KAA1102483.1 hypothetical protein PGT21_000358 [Puccinia graminis f. sp. tritici]KAA1102497.1 hypothetical protein PGT21_000916 [Puccinia graminis f. sp. tritici]
MQGYLGYLTKRGRNYGVCQTRTDSTFWMVRISRTLIPEDLDHWGTDRPTMAMATRDQSRFIRTVVARIPPAPRSSLAESTPSQLAAN